MPPQAKLMSTQTRLSYLERKMSNSVQTQWLFSDDELAKFLYREYQYIKTGQNVSPLVREFFNKIL